MMVDPLESVRLLDETYPAASYELTWRTPAELLVATVLAAQCSDAKVNSVTASLFQRYPTPNAFAAAEEAALAEALKGITFHRKKAKTLIALNKQLVEVHGGEVPQSMEALTALPGVARKSANVVLNCAFGIASGIIVDTHVARLAGRLGWSEEKRPEKIERELCALIPRDAWTRWGPALILHGRRVCTARAPRCGGCLFEPQCPKRGVHPAPADADGAPPVAPAPQPSSPERPARPRPARPSAVAGGLLESLPERWRAPLLKRLDPATARAIPKLEAFLAEERAREQVFPPPEDTFSALAACPPDAVRVVILGQDPYHGEGQANGLSFSVRRGVRVPPSLVNIYKELESSLAIPRAQHGDLSAWAAQGVLLLNTVLTVRAHQANSHRRKGWEKLTDDLIRLSSEIPGHRVFILWGRPAQKKRALIDEGRHTIIESAHPSPLSASRGFFGSDPFRRTNAALMAAGQSPIDWQLPDEPAPPP